MKDYEQYIGQKFNMWTVLSVVGKSKQSRTRVIAKCDCGTEREVSFSEIARGRSKACGCTRRENSAGALAGNSYFSKEKKAASKAMDAAMTANTGLLKTLTQIVKHSKDPASRALAQAAIAVDDWSSVRKRGWGSVKHGRYGL